MKKESLPRLENNIEREINPEFIKEIEESKFEINDKINLLLTMGGLKPASEIKLITRTIHNDEITEDIAEEDLEKAISIIKKSGLFFEIGETRTVKAEYRGKGDGKKYFQRDQITILVGRTQEEFEQLKKAIEFARSIGITGVDLEADTKEDLEKLKKKLHPHPPKKSDRIKYDEEMGSAFGYPPTAIEAFVGKRKKLNIKKLSKEIRESEAILFLSPTLSADNWREEIKQGQIWADFIKKVSPKIYKERMRLE